MDEEEYLDCYDDPWDPNPLVIDEDDLEYVD